jgi:hypothetical protein
MEGMVVFEGSGGTAAAAPALQYEDALESWVEELNRLDKRDKLSQSSPFCALCHLSSNLTAQTVSIHTTASLMDFAAESFRTQGPLVACIAVHMFYCICVEPHVTQDASTTPIAPWTRTRVAEHFLWHASTVECLGSLLRSVQMRAFVHESSLLIPEDKTIPVNKQALDKLDRIVGLTRRK